MKQIGKIIETVNIKEHKNMKPFELTSLYDDDETEITEYIDLQEIVSLKLINLMKELENKINNGRIKDKEAEKIKLDYYKTYISTINSFIKLNNDKHNVYFDKPKLINFLLQDNEKELKNK